MIDNSDIILDIRNLYVNFATPDGIVNAVNKIDITVARGECVGVVGESGSGKSQTFMASMGLLANNGSTTGQSLFKGKDLLTMKPEELNEYRGSSISMIFQDPLTSLAPHITIGEQMIEVLQVHQSMNKREASEIAINWLKKVRIPEAKRRFSQYPHELSGGMRQRVMIAMAMLCKPELLIADEPTTALDVTVQSEILDLIEELKNEHNLAIVLITHDMGVVARMCDRIEVMRLGKYVETGSAEDIFYNPQQEYTKMLIDSMPRIDSPEKAGHKQVAPYDVSAQKEGAGTLEIRDMKVTFPIKDNKGLFPRTKYLKAVDGVSFDLRPGETVGVVGESGCGKSTLARAILRLVKASGGSVSWLGKNIMDFKTKEMYELRESFQIVFQDPLASLNPRLTIGQSIMEPLKTHSSEVPKSEAKKIVSELMEKVGLSSDMINRYPHELSGGQNQRVGIARAIILKPKVLVCDESVSALDVSIQAQIIDLLIELQKEMGLSIIFISHDLSVVRQVSHRILVLYLGRLVEFGDRDVISTNPKHPYTKQLISAVPIPDPVQERARERIYLQGELSSPMDPKAVLRFMPSKIRDGDESYRPKIYEIEPDHWVAEHDPIEELLR